MASVIDPNPPAVAPGLPGEPAPLWFLIPEGFFALPLAASPQERAHRADAFVRELYSRGSEDIWRPAAPYYAAIAELLADTGISYAAMGLFSTSDEDFTEQGEVARHALSEGAAQCVLTLAAVPTGQPHGETDVVAQGIAAALRTDSLNDVRWLDLPCGPAVACISWRQFPIRPEATADGSETEVVTAQLQVHVPFPTAPFTAVFTMLTAYVDHWQQFCEMTEAILQTLSFTDPAGTEDSP
ncbi:hypothetical protein ACGFZL_06350 [Streptomyces sp. NPDC048182]|uniref:hypothetical protein n=1 Tax=Streptomyces sp. NPDC048182 TaxID=3365507 RepID=UPI00371D3D58